MTTVRHINLTLGGSTLKKWDLIMGRLLKSKIPTLIKPATGKIHKEAKAKDQQTRANRKLLRDTRRKATTKIITPGDNILIKQQKTTTKPPYDPKPYTVTKVKGTQITAVRGDQVKLRNAAKCKLLKDRPTYLIARDDTGSNNQLYNDSDDEDLFIKATSAHHQSHHVTPGVIEQPAVQHAENISTSNQPAADYRRFSTRTKKPPTRYTPS